MRILLVEDDFQLGRALQASLHKEGYSTDIVDNGRQAIVAVQTGDFDLLILDLGLPDIDGIQVLKTIRQQTTSPAVLILTARDAVEDKIKGLDLGADDYLVKPIDMQELFARLRVMSRRHGSATSAIITQGNISLDVSAHTLTIEGVTHECTKKEYMVLRILMENAGRVHSRDQLENKLYEWGEEVSSNAVEVHIHHLRKILPKNFIKTIRGVGYTVNQS